MLSSRAKAFYERTSALRDNQAAGYIFALAAVGLALLARYLVAGQLGGFPFLTFIPAVLITSFLCGWRAGAVAAALGALARWYFFVPAPPSQSTLDLVSGVPSLLGFSMYAFAVLVILAMVGAMHMAFQDFARSEIERNRLNAELEKRVRDRTEALEAANRRLIEEAASRASAEAQIRQLQKMEAVGQLTGGIAHDFNNMLAIVVGSLDIAGRSLKTDRERAGRFIANAMEGAQRGAQLTSRLLAFARRQPLAPRPLEANELLRDMSDLLRRSIGESIRLETHLAEGLWLTFVDASQLESAVINLCVNSRDAMPEGGDLAVRTSNEKLDEAYARANVEARPGDHVCIAVRDSGTGMAEDVLARACDPFFTTKSSGKGTGLGLSQVYGFVKQSGGHIAIESKLGHGTTVRIFLPRYAGAAQPAVPVPVEATPAMSNRETVLVVEDEERVRGMAVEALRNLGYSVMSASGPEQALDLVNAGAAPHLLFTDVVMPGMSGRTLADRIKERHPAVKIVFTTGSEAALGEDRAAVLLPKPFTLDQLAAKIRATLDAPG
jgi:signal transduction histidine kinase